MTPRPTLDLDALLRDAEHDLNWLRLGINDHDDISIDGDCPRDIADRYERLLAGVRSLRERQHKCDRVDEVLQLERERRQVLEARLNAAGKDDLAERLDEMDRIHPTPSDHPAGCHDPGLYSAAADRIRMDARVVEAAERHVANARARGEAGPTWELAIAVDALAHKESTDE